MTIFSEKQGTFPDFQGNRFSESTQESHYRNAEVNCHRVSGLVQRDLSILWRFFSLYL
jgi:hypothetical protein